MTASLLSLFSCSDEYLEDLNTDPSKAAEIDPNAQLTTAQLQTYGDLGMVEIYRNYIYGFTQQLMEHHELRRTAHHSGQRDEPYLDILLHEFHKESDRCHIQDGG